MLLALLGFCFACYLAQPLAFAEFGDSVTLLFLGFFATLVPWVLWMVGNRFFNDEASIPAAVIGIGSTYMTLWLLGEFNWLATSGSEIQSVLFVLVPQILKLGLVLHVIYMALSGREDDLLDNRLKLRVPIAASASVITGLVILVELWASGNVPDLIEVAGSIVMFLLALIAFLLLLKFRDELSSEFIGDADISQAAQSVNAKDEDPKLLQLIESLMTEQRFYALHGATLSDLANHLPYPAYKIRKSINKQLGFKNFNQFLNHYRIKEASARLTNDRNIPVLSIALDVGFKSMSSFNSAFKTAHSVTPTEYRNSHR